MSFMQDYRNIAYGNLDATDEIIEAAKQANIHDLFYT